MSGKIPLTSENLKELMDVFVQQLGGNGVNNTSSRTDRDPLIPKNETSVSVSDSDDDFEDIIRGERIPVTVHHERRSVTNAGTFFRLLKAYFSPALLSMPKAMSHLGLVPGVIGIVLFGVLFTYCIHILLEVNRAVVKRVQLDRLMKEHEDELRRLIALQYLANVVQGSINSVTEENSQKNTCAPKQEVKISKKQQNTKNWKLRFAPDIEVGESSKGHESHSLSSSMSVIPKKTKKAKNKKHSKLDAEVKESSLDKKTEMPSSSSSETIMNNSTNSENGDSESNRNNEQGQTEQPIIGNHQNNEQGQTEQPIIGNNQQYQPVDFPPLRTLPYPKLVELSFHYGMDKNKWAVKPVVLGVQLLMYLTHYGCCCVCFLFTAESLGEIATKGPFTHSNSFEMASYAIPFVVCISFLSSGHEMTAITTIAFLLQFCGVCMMGYYFFIGEHSSDLNLYIAPKETWYLYFGLIFYAFEGTGVALHLESHMENKQDFLGWKGILSKSMIFTIPVYAIVGGLGYWKFGNKVMTSVSFNLPEEHLPDMIQILIGMGVLFTYPFHLSMLLNPLKKILLDDSLTGTSLQIFDAILRIVFVVSTYVMAALVPYLELQLSVLGASASCFLVLFMPTFMSINSFLFLPDLNYSCCRLIFHAIIMLIGIAGLCLGSYMNFKNAHLYYPNSTIFG